MATAPSPPWKLGCPYCSWYVLAHNRGAHGRDPGAGVEAAQARDEHVELWHPEMVEGGSDD